MYYSTLCLGLDEKRGTHLVLLFLYLFNAGHIFVVCLYNVVCDVQWRLCCTWHKSSTCQVINFFDNRQSDERKRNDNDVYICNIYIYLVYLVNNLSYLYLSIYILYSDWQRDPYRI